MDFWQIIIFFFNCHITAFKR